MVQTNYKVIVRSELRSERAALKKKGSHGMDVTDENELKRILKAYDVDGDGWLSKNELKEAFRKLGSRFPALRAALGLNHADANNDGYISDGELDQLVKYIVNHGFACY